MRWYFKMLEKTPMYYRYAYSRESKDLDGEIIYFIATKEARIEKPCLADKDSQLKAKTAIDHFWTVVKEKFPYERSVCCG